MWEGWPSSPGKAFFIPTTNLESAFQSLTKKRSKYQSEICELQKMKLYATNTAECRRVLLLNYLDGEGDAEGNWKLKCEDCLLIEAMDSMEIEDEVSTGIPGSRCRRFTNEQKQVIKTHLIHLNKSQRQMLRQGIFLTVTPLIITSWEFNFIFLNNIFEQRIKTITWHYVVS